MKLSIVIPAHNEEENIAQTVLAITVELEKERIEHEIVVVDDNSTDKTGAVADDLSARRVAVKVLHRLSPKGFGRAVSDGLKAASGECMAVVMGDLSDDPRDIVKCFRKIEEGYDCVFGSRFIKGSTVVDYPFFKLSINRMANLFIQALFFTRANDITNAFKLYKREVIRAVEPLEAPYFNITVEIPLKAIVRGFSFAQVPINWYGRKSGVSKLSIKEMGRRYLFTVLSIWRHRVFARDKMPAKQVHVK